MMTALFIFIYQQTLALLSGYMDRMRGDPKHFGNRLVEKLLYGLFICSTFVLVDVLYGSVVFDWLYILLLSGIVLGFSVGISTGWGEPMSALLYRHEMDQEELEWWQFGKLKENPLYAMIARGFMTGIPIWLVAWIDPKVMLISVAMMIAMPLSILIVRSQKRIMENYDAWAIHEYVRGYLFQTVLFLLLITWEIFKG